MGEHYKINTGDFTEYLQSVVKLNALEKMTQDLDKELADSQNIMMEIKAMYDTVSIVQNNRPEPVNSVVRPEEISRFLDSNVPQLLMPDMTQENMDMDIDDVIATLKTYTEDLKKNFAATQTQTPKPKELIDVDLEQYAQSLDQLSKRVANIKLNKKSELNNRNTELEGKLTQLCEDVNQFTKVCDIHSTLYYLLLAYKC